MSSKPRLDLTGMQPEDAAALRRYATAIEAHLNQYRIGFWSEAISGAVARFARKTADRLDAGDVAP